MKANRLLPILLLILTVALLAHVALVDVAAQSEPRPTPTATATVAGPQPLPTISTWVEQGRQYIPVVTKATKTSQETR